MQCFVGLANVPQVKRAQVVSDLLLSRSDPCMILKEKYLWLQDIHQTQSKLNLFRCCEMVFTSMQRVIYSREPKDFQKQIVN
jgi:hypothetical protein